MNKMSILGAALSLSLAGCATESTFSNNEVFVALISERCQEHAAMSKEKGHRYFPSYSECMNNTLIYLKSNQKE